MRRCVRFLLILLAGCSASVSSPGLSGRGKAPTTAEERVILKHILDHAGEPDSVVVATWGPHLPAGPGMTIDTVRGKEHFPEEATYRVHWRQKNAQGGMEAQDYLFTVADGRVKSGIPNGYGEKWVERYRQILKDAFPGQ